MTKNKSTLPSIGTASTCASEPLKESTVSLNTDRLDKLDLNLQKALELFPIPGFAVCIVIDGKVAFSKGYGFRDVENQLPITEKTLFAIGSCSKAFTTFALGQLVDEGIIGWDDPVIKHLPEFRLKDLHATHHLTIRDLVTHRSGLPSHNLVWFNSKISRAELLSRLQYLEPNFDLREKFQYNNLMYAVAGLLIEKVTGKTWEEFVQSRIFAPLGMNLSNFSVEESQKSDDFSLPYLKKDEKIQEIPFRNIATVGPAGSINSSIEDMAKWMQLQLSDGSLNETHFINKATLKAMHVIQTSMQSPVFSSPEESSYIFGYGLGWMTGFHKGRYVVTHGGGIDGFISNVLFLPNEKTGVVVLSNSGSCSFAAYACYGIIDSILGIEEETWVSQIEEKEKKLWAALFGKVESKEFEPMQASPLSEYIGEFENPGYGLIKLSLNENNLIAPLNEISYVLKHSCYDHFIASTNIGLFEQKLECFFTRSSSGEVSEFHFTLEPLVAPIVFKRKASSDLLKPEYLKQFEGTFESDLFNAIFSYAKDRLIATLQEPDSGELHFTHINVLQNKEEMRKVLGYLPQEFGVYPMVSAEDLLHHLAILKGIVDSKERKKTVDTLLEMTNLSQHRKKKLGGFSGGMKQRFGIAQALLGDPRIIIVDEPTAGLDPEERDRFHNLLANISEDKLIILSTHIVSDVIELCNDMAIIQNGTVLMQSAPLEATQILQGKIWKTLVPKTEIESLSQKHKIVSSRLLYNNSMIKVYSESRPGLEFEATQPDLEDVYFSFIKGYERK